MVSVDRNTPLTGLFDGLDVLDGSGRTQTLTAAGGGSLKYMLLTLHFICIYIGVLPLTRESVCPWGVGGRTHLTHTII